MTELIAGVLTTIFIMFVGRFNYFKFDEERSYYPTILMVIALYYVLFAVMESQIEVIVAEIAVASLFITGALYGAVRSLRLVAVLLILHGIYDVIHPHFMSYDSVPAWWPMYCFYVDAILGFWILFRYSNRTKN